MTNSRAKGARGELELSKILKRLYPDSEARRGQQFAGSPDSPDVVGVLSEFQIECKRYKPKAGLIGRALAQAERDGAPANKPGLAFYRGNREDWIVALRPESIADLAQAHVNATGKPLHPQQ